MREVFQQELREVQERLVEISTLVEISIENATRAFNESNVSLAETVIADDDKIDELTVSLDELPSTSWPGSSRLPGTFGSSSAPCGSVRHWSEWAT
jgi:hypothetical protein